MKKYMRFWARGIDKFSEGLKRIFILSILFVVFLPFKTFAQGAYSIMNYETVVVINSNNVFDVETTLVVKPLAEVVDIDYVIPIKLNDLKYKIKVSNIKVDGYKVTKKIDRDNITVRIHDEKAFITKTYNISYTIDFGEDYDVSKDVVNFPLISNTFASGIDSCKFTVLFPEEININNVKFDLINCDGDLLNRVSLTDRKVFNYAYNREGKVLTASYIGKLSYSSGMIMHLELLEGYFNGERNLHFLMVSMTVLSILFLLYISFKFFYIGRDEVLLAGPDFKTLANYSPSEIGVLYEIYINKSKDDVYKVCFKNLVLSMIVRWANNGYLAVKEDSRVDEDGDRNITIFKTNDLASNDNVPIYEKMLFDALFRLGDGVSIDFRNLKRDYKDDRNSAKFINVKEYINAFKNQFNDHLYNIISYGDQVKCDKLELKLRILPFVAFNVFGLIFSLSNYRIIADMNYWFIYLIISSIICYCLRVNSKNDRIIKPLGCAINLVFALGLHLPFVIYILLSIASFEFIFVRKYNFLLSSYLKAAKEFDKLINQKTRARFVEVATDRDFFYEGLPYAISTNNLKKYMYVSQGLNVLSPEWYVYNELSNKTLNLYNMENFLDDVYKIVEILDSFS